MFSKGNRSASQRSSLSIVGSDCTFVGNIIAAGEVQIDGKLEGDVRCSNLVIGEKGSITGEINAETVTVLGAVTGQITAKTVSLAKTARILGDITHDCLSVSVGAYVEGRFNRLSAQLASETANAVTEEQPGRAVHAPSVERTRLPKGDAPDTADWDRLPAPADAALAEP